MVSNKKRILIVEDNLTAAKVNQMIFESLDCQTEHVNDGDKAVEMMKENHYDGICMDIGLPTMSGTKACLAIRDYEAKNQLIPVPIVAVTANASLKESEEYMKAGMQKVIEKPLDKQKAEMFLTFCNQA